MSLFDTFASDCAYILNDIGRTVTFRSQEVKAVVADPAVSNALVIGGLSEAGSNQSFKFLRSAYAANLPQTGEIILFDGKKWVIETVEQRPLSPWAKCNCRPWES